MTESEYDKWLDKSNIYVSKPLFKILFKDWGFYILPSYNYYLFPKFFYMKTKYFIEMGFSFAGFHFEIQNNKIEKIQKDRIC